MGVLDPVKVVITDLPAASEQTLDFANHPQNPDMGRRPVSFSKELYIEREDFAEVPPPKYQRLIPGGEVRLRGSYVIRCDSVIKDENGHIQELHCTHDPDTLGKNPEGRKVKGVIHWVDAATALKAEVRLYETLFTQPNPAAADNLADVINAESVKTLTGCYVEPALAEAKPETRFQFERMGYFVADRWDHSSSTPTFNRTVTLRDTWAKR